MKQEISIEDAKHIAHLTNLTLTQEELAKLSVMLSDTLEYVAVLKELDTSNVPETFQVTGLSNVYREANFPDTSLTQAEVLANAFVKRDSKIGTKKVLEKR
jgi:aspartyl-tRNA(Asn)/glutamyl-tRNA(Gln) amidotransferase subunit C